MKENQRLGYLDSIRGLAACVVVLTHCWLVSTTDTATASGPLKAAFSSVSSFFVYFFTKFVGASRFAVIIFFVLSGFVLAFSLLKRPTPYAGYAIRRVFRIYPTFLVVVLSSYVLHLLIGVRHPVNSEWFRHVIDPDLSLTVLFKQLALWGTDATMGLDNVAWTLVHEMRISLLFPLILVSVVRYGWRSVLVYWILSLAYAMSAFHRTGMTMPIYYDETLGQSLITTCYYFVFFAAGAYLAIHRAKISSKAADLPRWKKIILFVFSLCCLFMTNSHSNTYISFTNDYFHGLGALGLIALALGLHKFKSALSHGIPVWLGRISYSLYLVHVPILYVVGQTIGASWSGIQICIAAVPLSLLTAEILARAVEFPSIERGKKLVARLRLSPRTG